MKDRFYKLCQENGRIHIGYTTNTQNIGNKQSTDNSAIATLCGIVSICESLVDTDVYLFLSQIDISKVTCDECRKVYFNKSLNTSP